MNSIRYIINLILISILYVSLISCGLYDSKSPAVPYRLDLSPQIESDYSKNGLKAILSTRDFGTGNQRFAVLLISKTGFVTNETVNITTSLVQKNQNSQQLQKKTAIFYQWENLAKGTYVANFNFNKSGTWEALIEVLNENNNVTKSTDIKFEVKKTSYTTKIGKSAKSSKTKTINDVDSLNELSTGSKIYPNLYQTSLEHAVNLNKPVIVSFASPGYCIERSCGPQTDVLNQMQKSDNSKLFFIHVELYENPEKILGNPVNKKLSQAAIEWNLPSAEWTFIIIEKKVVAKYEGFVTKQEILSDLQKILY
ncbi:MAG: hypothetical protein CL770_02010 [Chloroflexi bacterium]|nr:hypothetical protein [Chloroflexota bacterium]|tara:strand:- start:22205 stop:23134 length:930 start_codon:yes stop_codon:yes gene_type:complete